ncbi:MAG: histidine phosphatase family protein [Solirubrobacterales bacterium]|nr:histidine phosphatase family protein [Solirubrobacterales bacterium]
MSPNFQRPFTRPTGATELVLVRHGASAQPAEDEPFDLTGDHSDPALSEAGHRQAEAVAARLKDEPAGGVFVTPLLRTAQTAAPLLRRTSRQATVVHELREVQLGAWEGRLNRALAGDRELSRRVFAAERWDVIPGAEPMDGFATRVAAGLRVIAGAVGRDATAIAVVHGGVIAEACRQATGSQAFAFLYADNGSITRLLLLPSGRWALRGFNDIAHL